MAQNSIAAASNNPVIARRDAVNRVRKLDSHRTKCEELHAALTKNLRASELKVISFVAACNKKVVKPFPLHMVEESPEGLQYLDGINKKILKLEILKYFLENSRRYKVEEPVIELLHWLICGLQNKLRLQSLSESLNVHEAVLQLVQTHSELAMPTMCFKIKYWAQSWEHLQWEELRMNKTTSFAFLKTEIHQLHSLIHLGVGPFVNSYEDVGSGVLLTNNLEFCLEATVPAWVWGKNSIGLQMKTVALVEFIDDQATALNPENDDQGTFYLVNSASAVRPRFLLLFKKDPILAGQPLDVTRVEERQAYRVIDRLLSHLPCMLAYLGLGYFLVRESKAWRSWSVNGVRALAVTLIGRFSGTAP